jgi:hypothetical protein
MLAFAYRHTDLAIWATGACAGVTRERLHMPAWVTSPPDTAASQPTNRQAQPASSRKSDRLTLLVLCVLVFLAAALRGVIHPMWFDEVATTHIAGARSWNEMIRLSRLVDLHPPLEPILVRLSFHLFGAHEFGAHLPSVLGLTTAVGCLFAFLRRRVNIFYAVAGALLPICNPDLFSYVTEARPYGLLFGAVSVAVLAYDTLLREEHPVAARIFLAISLTAALQSHLFGTFAAGAFILAETVRTARTRRIDVATWIAVLLPWLSCVTYIPLLRIQAAGHGSPMVYEEKNRTSLAKGVLFYYSTFYTPIAPFFKLVALVLLCVRYFPAPRFTRYFQITPELGTALLVLLASPILVTVLLHLRAPGSGFFPRYAIAAVPPALLLISGIIAWRAGESRPAALILLIAVLIGCALSLSEVPGAAATVARHGVTGAPPDLDKTGDVEGLCPQLPLVMNDALEFLEADFRLGPAHESRMVYLTDPAESLRLEHENATQAVNGMSRAFETSHHVLPAASFLAAHPDFVLLMRPRHTGWLGDKLQEEHARIELLGHYKFAGNNSDLYLVTQPGKGPYSATPGCPAH